MRCGPETPAAIVEAGLLHDTDLSGWRAWLDASGATDLPVPGGPVFEDFNLLRAAALAGQGVALCPRVIVAEDIREGRLMALSETAIREECGYYIIGAKQDSGRAPTIDTFRAWLLSTAPEK